MTESLQQITLLCEECDQREAAMYCQPCGQSLCTDCDAKIHNKGKRALHERTPLEQKQYPLELGSTKRNQLSMEKIFYSDTLLVTYAQPLTNDSSDQNLSIMLKAITQNYLEMAKNGNLMVLLKPFKKDIIEQLLTERPTWHKSDCDFLINKLKEIGFIHVTTRKFGDSRPLKYLSLLLKNISIESLVWVLRSIKCDRMTPTDKLVLSRIKEYFALKISSKDWTNFLEILHNNPEAINKHESF